MYVGLHVKYLLYLSDFNESFLDRFKKKNSNIKFYENPSVQWQPNISLRTDGRTNVKKLMVAFRNFANSPKKASLCGISNFRVMYSVNCERNIEVNYRLIF